MEDKIKKNKIEDKKEIIIKDKENTKEKGDVKVKEEKKDIEEEKIEEKKDILKKKVEKIKKEEATVNGYDLNISTKHAIAVCSFIKGKKIDVAIKDLEDVLKKRKAIPMNREVSHKKGIERGRYPEKATKATIRLLKSLNSNASMLEIEEPFIFFVKADKASRPYRRGGGKRFKRSHISIIARSKQNKLNNKIMN